MFFFETISREEVSSDSHQCFLLTFLNSIEPSAENVSGPSCRGLPPAPNRIPLRQRMSAWSSFCEDFRVLKDGLVSNPLLKPLDESTNKCLQFCVQVWRCLAKIVPWKGLYVFVVCPSVNSQLGSGAMNKIQGCWAM